MRAIMFVTMFLLLGAVGWAQTSAQPPAPASGAAARPEAGTIANQPFAPPARGPEMGWPPFPPGAPLYWRHHPRGVLIVDLILRVIVTLAASFALVALGIFLIRRSTAGPVARV